jgi:ech hydrogenase subunit A
MVNLGVYLLLRISPNISTTPAMGTIVALVGGASFLMSSLLAMTQSNAKLVLAWSTVGNLGLMVMCAGIASPLAVAAGLILLFYHSISKALMFLAVGAVKERIGSEDIEDMRGIRATMPFITIALFLGTFTLVLPPFGMFASKWLVSVAASTVPLLIFLLALGFAGIVVFYFKWLGTLLSAGSGVRAVPLKEDPLPRNYRWVLGSLMVGAVVLSVLIGPILRYLIAPFIDLYYDLPLNTDDINLVTLNGSFPAVIFLALTAAIFIGLLFLARPSPRRKAAKVYAGGEEFEFVARGNYYIGEGLVNRTITASHVIGILLVAALLVLPALLEVL